eukprot:CAMPEP_0179366862 /NCGR_PEP_ID=MMETSP0797-20121207/83278_1 /TAXON_ID=47934 /ORGANISM="Dinophysis acuminata, Strain DAEP01" /LENGTH=83 /DNA_ID=CAMNT_0021082395 /DNA_START=289 /DNA_END=536 /DNA_ORIENTATION=+
MDVLLVGPVHVCGRDNCIDVAFSGHMHACNRAWGVVPVVVLEGVLDPVLDEFCLEVLCDCPIAMPHQLVHGRHGRIPSSPLLA